MKFTIMKYIHLSVLIAIIVLSGITAEGKVGSPTNKAFVTSDELNRMVQLAKNREISSHNKIKSGMTLQQPCVWEALRLLKGFKSASDSFPNMTSIPPARVKCSDFNQAGFYADIDYGCQVFRKCDAGEGMSSYLCPVGTIFNQITLTCDYWYNVNCSSSVNYQDYTNSRLYHPTWPLLDDCGIATPVIGVSILPSWDTFVAIDDWGNNNWAFGCDFIDGDLSNARVAASDCGGTCAATPGCTHFAWTSLSGGTCWMKQGAVTKNDAVSSSVNGIICGVMDAITSSTPANMKYVEVFRDDFSGTVVDTGKWNLIDKPSTVNGELEYYTPDDVFQQSGFVFLRAEKRNQGGRDYTSGRIDTKDKFDFLYGEVEWRAKWPKGKGLWPALWLLQFQCVAAAPCAGTWPPEIDVMEARGETTNEIVQTLIYGRNPIPIQYDSKNVWGPDYTQDFHTYKVIWDPNQVTFFVDGQQTQKITDSKQIPRERMYLIMNLAVGGNFVSPPDNTTPFPADLIIDYVTVHRWQ